MDDKTKKLRDRIAELQFEMKIAENNLDHIVQNCNHAFDKTIYDPIHTPAYTIPGDMPGTMGVDFRGPCYVEAKTEKRWRRECTRCGKIEYTTNVKQNITEEPNWLKNY